MRKLVIGCAIALVPALASADKTFTSAKNAAWDCAKEPTVHIMHGEGNYTFKGACKLISIQGGQNKLIIESVDVLSVTGGSNVVDIGTVDTIKVIGANNQVTWKKAKSGDKPRTTAIGADNKFEQSK
jgi:hypothetical protein